MSEIRRHTAGAWHQKGFGGCGEGNVEVILNVFKGHYEKSGLYLPRSREIYCELVRG